MRQLEKEGLGMVIETPHTAKTQQNISASFVDDNDLVADGELAEQNMHKMTDEHGDNHAATGGCVESKKQKIVHGNGSCRKEIKRCCRNVQNWF